jgi:hypothetical protein
MAMVHVILPMLGWPAWTYIISKLLLILAWTAVSFMVVFVKTERFDMLELVEQSRLNDLSDPEVYYLGWEKKEVESNDDKPGKKVKFDNDVKPSTEYIRKQKPESEQSPSHFWVMMYGDELVGMVGLAHYTKTMTSKRNTPPSVWKLMLVNMMKRYHIKLPKSLENIDEGGKSQIFAHANKPKDSTLTHLIVRSDMQGCGLSTLLINRVMSWANEKGLESVSAVTNEIESDGASILKVQHGFKLVKKEKTGWLGQKRNTWECDVKNWIEEHPDGGKPYTKAEEKK